MSMRTKIVLSALCAVLAATTYLVFEPVVIDCGRLTVTTEEATSGDQPEYRAYTYGSHEYEDYTCSAYWPSGQYRKIPFNQVIISQEDYDKFNILGRHEIEVTYQKGKTTLKIEVVLPDDPFFHVLIFDSAGGLPVEAMLNIPTGTVVQLPVPHKAGHEFVGWFTTPGLDGMRVDSQTPITQSMVLYARW